MSTTQKIIAAVAALIIVAILGTFGWGQYRKVAVGGEVTELATDSSNRLREALAIRVDPALAGRPDTQATLEAHVAAMSQHVARFEGMDVKRIRMLGYAAGEFLSAAHGIVRLQAASQKMHSQVNDATQVLVAHFGTVGNRRGDWIHEAMRRKEHLDRVNAEYRRAIEAYESMLGDFPSAQAELARELGPAVAIDRALIEKARSSARNEAARAAEAVARAKKLAVTR